MYASERSVLISADRGGRAAGLLAGTERCIILWHCFISLSASWWYFVAILCVDAMVWACCRTSLGCRSGGMGGWGALSLNIYQGGVVFRPEGVEEG